MLHEGRMESFCCLISPTIMYRNVLLESIIIMILFRVAYNFYHRSVLITVTFLTVCLDFNAFTCSDHLFINSFNRSFVRFSYTVRTGQFRVVTCLIFCGVYMNKFSENQMVNI